MANTKITSDNLDTLTTLTIDDLTLNGSTISGTGDITLDAVGDIRLDANGGDIIFQDNGTDIAKFSNNSSDLQISVETADKDIKFNGTDGSSGITALTLDMSDAGSAYFNNKVGIGTTSPSKKLEVDGNVKFGNVGKVETGTNTFKASSTGSNGFFLRSAVSSVSNPSISDVDDTDTGMYFPAANTLGLATGGTNILRVKQSNNQPQYTFGTNNTSNGLHGPSFIACLASGSVGTNYFFQLYEAEDNFSAASLKLGGLLASSSYALANPDRGDIYVQDNISAASVTDRTPYPTSLQLAKDVINSHQRRSEEEITRLATAQYNKIQAKDEMPQPEREALSLEQYLEKYKKEYELDHSVLHDYVNDTKYADVGIEGRDASATVSCLVEVVKDLMKRLEAIENG